MGSFGFEFFVGDLTKGIGLVFFFGPHSSGPESQPQAFFCFF